MRFRIHFADRNGGTTGVNQVIDYDETFTVAFGTFQHFQFALVVVIVAGDAYGIDMTNTQFTRQQCARYQTTTANGNNAFPLFRRHQAACQFTCMDLQHVPGDDVFFAHVKCPSLFIYGLKVFEGEIGCARL